MSDEILLWFIACISFESNVLLFLCLPFFAHSKNAGAFSRRILSFCDGNLRAKRPEMFWSRFWVRWKFIREGVVICIVGYFVDADEWRCEQRKFLHWLENLPILLSTWFISSFVDAKLSFFEFLGVKNETKQDAQREVMRTNASD